MGRVAVVTGADRGLGLALCKGLLKKGWIVFARQYMKEWPELSELASEYPEALHIIPLDVSSDESAASCSRVISGIADHVDMLISNAGVSGQDGDIRGGMNLTISKRAFNVNALGSMRMVQSILPLMDDGMKRICFISSEAGSIGVCTRSGSFGYCMSKTALNMAIRIMYNDLYPKGFTFRIFHPGWLRTYMSGQKNTNGLYEPEESAEAAIPYFIEDSACEGRLVMIDNRGEAWPF